MYPIRYLFRTVIALTLLMGLYGAHAQCTVTNAGPRGFNFPASGGGGNVTVQTTPIGCTDFSISQVGTFFSAYKTGSSIIISCNVNATLFTRTGRVNVGDIVIQVSQCAALSPPTAITGSSTVCYGSTASYTAAAVAGASSYFWSPNNGAVVVSGQNTSMAEIRFVNPGSTTVSVAARSLCGDTGPARTYVVNSVTNSSAIPGIPGSIAGSTKFCVNTTQTYSIANPVAGATTYTWSGGTVISGQGTRNAQMTFPNGQRMVSVTAGNNCGSSSASSLSVTVDAIPNAPTEISAPPNFCAGEVKSFTALPIESGGYEWTVEGSNWLITSGLGTASIGVQIGTGSGTIKVRKINGACKSAEITRNFPMANVQLFPVTGDNSICPGESTTIRLNGSVEGYTYTAYRNNQPIFGEDPSAKIAVMGTNGSLEFGPFTQAGQYTIKGAYTSCEAMMTGSVNVVVRAAKPDQASIPWTTVTNVCRYGSVTFNADPLPRAESYIWTVTGGTVISGQNTLTAQIQFNTTTAGTVTVAGVNSCGTGIASPARQLNVTTVGQPAFQTPAPNPCAGGTYTFRVNGVAGNEYTWVIPSGWEMLGGQGTSSIGVRAGRYDG